jgi:NAD(P)-dependent dehydrogenase (short-subunit alcohol dehydrogenase family)
MADKTVLVTGACGEIGQALVQELSKRGGCRIVTAASPSAGGDQGPGGRARPGGCGLQGEDVL